MRTHYDKKEPKIYRSVRGKWKVRFYDEGTDSYKDKVVPTKTEAEILRLAIARGDDLSRWFADAKTGTNRKWTFSDLAEKWMEHGKNVRRLSGSCLQNYDTHLRNHILPVFGQVRADRLSIDDIENLAREINNKVPQTKSYTALRKNNWSGDDFLDDNSLALSYQREILTVACMITTWASKRRPAYLIQNPFEEFKLPDTPENLFDYWSQEDEDKFFDWIESGGHYEKLTTRYRHRGKSSYVMKLQIRNPQEIRDIVMMALRTGMRLGEIGALRNMDVDLNNGFLIVKGSFSRKEKVRKNTTKSKKPRRIEINADVREIFHRLRFVDQAKPLFNIHQNSIKIFPRTCRWAGAKEIHFHSLRHTCLTNLANGYGMERALPLPKVQQIAGHSDIKTTMRYVHNDIIKETASLQWSREEKKKRSEEPSVGDQKEEVGEDQSAEKPPEMAESESIEQVGNVVAIKKGLRLVISSKR
ncbi:MAG: tyrosine-type recombinase/integrase [Oligoflexales bacterium]